MSWTSWIWKNLFFVFPPFLPKCLLTFILRGEATGTTCPAGASWLFWQSVRWFAAASQYHMWLQQYMGHVIWINQSMLWYLSAGWCAVEGLCVHLFCMEPQQCYIFNWMGEKHMGTLTVTVQWQNIYALHSRFAAVALKANMEHP